MIGYAAVTGTVTIDSTILFLIIFIWTPPHFWALALYKLSDYGRVGIPMMPYLFAMFALIGVDHLLMGAA